MAKTHFFFTLIISIITVIISVFLIKYVMPSKNEIVYVNNFKIFNNFKMTNELKLKGEKELNLKKRILDSLYFSLNTLTNDDLKDVVVEKIIKQKEQIEEFQNSYSTVNSNAIWKRINLYCKDFSEENGYKIIQGGYTEETVFSVNSDLDVTNQLLVYINKRYEGFN